MIDSKVRLTGNGYTVTLTDSADQLHRAPNGSGWGMAPVANSWYEGAGDGARLGAQRRLRRELVIPIQAFGHNPREVETNIRNLVRIVRDPFIVHVDLDGGESFWIEAVYVSGIEGAYTTTPDEWNDMEVVLHCPDPYWTSESNQSFLIAPAGAGTPFLVDFAALNVASSAAFGTVAVTNIGDVDSQPTWTIQGPGADLVIEVDGEGFALNRTLLTTDTITVEYIDGGWTITDQTGANLYGDLETSPAPYFPSLPPGGAIVTGSMTGTGAGSYIRCVYPERREVVY